jgi:hypothetical protein
VCSVTWENKCDMTIGYLCLLIHLIFFLYLAENAGGM